MGTSVTSYHIRSEKLDEAVRLLTRLIRSRAYVSNPENGWITVVDETSERLSEEQPRLGLELSASMHCRVVSLWVFDSDTCGYILYDRGELEDVYASNQKWTLTNYPQMPATGQSGDPLIFSKYCPNASPNDVENALRAKLVRTGRKPKGAFRDDHDRLRAITRLLNIRESRSFYKFKDFAKASSVRDRDQFQLLSRTTT